MHVPCMESPNHIPRAFVFSKIRAIGTRPSFIQGCQALMTFVAGTVDDDPCKRSAIFLTNDERRKSPDENHQEI